MHYASWFYKKERRWTNVYLKVALNNNNSDITKNFNTSNTKDDTLKLFYFLEVYWITESEPPTRCYIRQRCQTSMIENILMKYLYERCINVCEKWWAAKSC